MNASRSTSSRIALKDASSFSVEAASPLGWHRWVGDHGDVVAMEGFGASAPAGALYKHFGFTGENVAARARAVLEAVATPS